MTDRRTFLALLGVAAATSTLGAGSASAEGDSEDSTDAANEDEGADAAAEALLEYVVALYGDRLDVDDRDVVLGGIEGSLASGDAFRDVGLENADEPALGFSPYRGDRS